MNLNVIATQRYSNQHDFTFVRLADHSDPYRFTMTPPVVTQPVTRHSYNYKMNLDVLATGHDDQHNTGLTYVRMQDGMGPHAKFTMTPPVLPQN